MKQRNTLLIAAITGGLGLLLVGQSSAALIGTTGDLPTGIRRTSGYYGGSGGEFTIASTGLDLSGYVSGASGTSLVAGSFQTFCLEKNEYTFNGSSGNGNFRVNTQALKGGKNTQNGDDLSQAVAWLYCQFASKDWEAGTPVYDYVVGDRDDSAAALQNAIWFLEEELTNVDAGLANPFVQAALDKFGTAGDTDLEKLVDARMANAAGGFGVYVLNNFDGTGFKQDQLYYNPNGERVPDGGANLLLLGLALSGLSFFRRRLKA